MPCLRAKTFEDNWCPFHGLLSTFAQTKIPTKMGSKNPNSRAFEGLCSNYPQFQKYLKQYRNNTTTITHRLHKVILKSHKKCRVSELNQGHRDFQSLALPTELTRHLLNMSIILSSKIFVNCFLHAKIILQIFIGASLCK